MHEGYGWDVWLSLAWSLLVLLPPLVQYGILMRVVGWLSICNWDSGDKVQTNVWNIVDSVWYVWSIWLACRKVRMVGWEFK